ncbi:hypothetical protein [Nocardia miyunensis]|uniref:hypothetical protein n=1 Tax=Nocardia miyunensis TaxID=282684 RepID=UPI00082F187A|nr:hypothetical protein [Nocardia miyunensis]
MGLFFEHPVQRVPADVVRAEIRRALLDSGKDDAAAVAAQRMAILGVEDPRLESAITTALQISPPSESDADDQACAAAATLAAAPPSQFFWGRAMLSVVLFAVLAAMGFWSDATRHPTSATSFFGFAGAVFGVVTALLSAEKARS